MFQSGGGGADGRPGPLRAAWNRRKLRAFPPDAILFQLRAWTRGSLDAEGRAAARELRHRNGFADLLLLHGSAMRMDAGIVLLVGPPGLGKSTVCRAVARKAKGHLLEDGLLLVGRRGDRWWLVETGTTALFALKGRITKLIRTLTFLGGTEYTDAAMERRSIRQSIYANVVDRPGFLFAVLLGRRARNASPGRVTPVNGVVLVEHSVHGSLSYRLTDDAMEPIPRVGPFVPASVALEELTSIGPLGEVRERFRAALWRLGSGAADPRVLGGRRPQAELDAALPSAIGLTRSDPGRAVDALSDS